MNYELFINILTPNNIIIYILIFARLSGLFVIAPVFSTYPPIQIKIWFMAILSYIFFPYVLKISNIEIPTSMPILIIYTLKEFLVGFTIGFLANFLFYAMQMSGHMISLQSGLSASNVMDPSTGEQTPVIGEFYLYILSIIFIILNAYHPMFLAIYESFIKLPLGFDTIFNSNLIDLILKFSSNIFTLSISFVLPIFCVLFILQILLGFISKIIPQLNVYMVAMPLQILIAFALMLMFLSPMVSFLTKTVQNYFIIILKIFS